MQTMLIAGMKRSRENPVLKESTIESHESASSASARLFEALESRGFDTKSFCDMLIDTESVVSGGLIVHCTAPLHVLRVWKDSGDRDSDVDIFTSYSQSMQVMDFLTEKGYEAIDTTPQTHKRQPARAMRDSSLNPSMRCMSFVPAAAWNLSQKVDVIYPSFEHTSSHTRIMSFEEQYGYEPCVSGRDIVTRSFDLGCCAAFFDGRHFDVPLETALGLLAQRHAVTDSPTHMVPRVLERQQLRTKKYIARGFVPLGPGESLIHAAAKRLESILQLDMPIELVERVVAFLISN